MTKIRYNPADLRPVSQLYQEGKFPPDMTLRHILDLCTARKIGCVKIRGKWNTSEAHIRAFVWERANPAFKKISS
jgi:hypothetical protein